MGRVGEQRLPMSDARYVQHMARYNRWQNENLYGVAEGLSDEERRRERGAFFGSIHRRARPRLDRRRPHLVLWCGQTRYDQAEIGALDALLQPPNASPGTGSLYADPSRPEGTRQ